MRCDTRTDGKISHLVSDKGSRAFGLLASPDMLATAAIAHWREGVVTGAVRHLDAMFARRAESKKVCLHRSIAHAAGN